MGARAVFPGGFLPTLTFMVETLAKGSQGRLVVDSVSNIGPHYARTLREWRRRFEADLGRCRRIEIATRCCHCCPEVRVELQGAVEVGPSRLEPGYMRTERCAGVAKL